MIDSTPDGLNRRVALAVLEAVSHSASLFDAYVLKGGLALSLLYGSPRLSTDLDFNAVSPSANTITEETNRTLLDFCKELDLALSAYLPARGFVHMETSDVRLSTEIPALLGYIRYELEQGQTGQIPTQTTLSEIVCNYEVRMVDGTRVHVASLEDIIAEKLKAILQQVPRQTARSSDIFDVWYFACRSPALVRAEDVTAILLEKRKQWPNMPLVTKSAFRTDEVISFSESEFDEALERLSPGADRVPFREAYAAVLRFIRRLGLPE